MVFVNQILNIEAARNISFSQLLDVIDGLGNRAPFNLLDGSLYDDLLDVAIQSHPMDAKPFKGVGSGVLEIALRFASDAYRVVTAVQLGRRIYVLHAFQKKSKKGIETPKREIDLIRKRYAEAQELAHEHEETSIH